LLDVALIILSPLPPVFVGEEGHCPCSVVLGGVLPLAVIAGIWHMLCPGSHLPSWRGIWLQALPPFPSPPITQKLIFLIFLFKTKKTLQIYNQVQNSGGGSL